MRTSGGIDCRRIERTRANQLVYRGEFGIVLIRAGQPFLCEGRAVQSPSIAFK
jgi:hypothetical protein